MGKKDGKEIAVDALVTAASVTSLIPGVGSAVGFLRTLYAEHQQARFDALWAHVAKSDTDPDELQDKIAESLANSKGTIGVAFVAAARAAADAFDPVVLESIGLLAQRHLRTGIPDRVEYRHLLTMFTGLDEEEYVALRAGLQLIRGLVAKDGRFLTNLLDERGPDLFGWYWYSIPGRSDVGKTCVLASGPVAVRIVDALERLGRRHFVVTSTSDPSLARKGSLSAETAALLADIMPLPSEGRSP